MDGDGLNTHQAGGVLTLTLDRPATNNALDDALVEGITHAVSQAVQDKALRVIVLVATGKHFSAGVDLARLAQINDRPVAESIADGRAIGDMLEAVRTSPLPVVAAVQGAVFGGALALVAACDVVIAADVARFGAGEARIGLVPVLLTPYLAAAIGDRPARHLLLTCERISAKQAHPLGLVQRVVPAEALQAELRSVVVALRLSGPGSIAATKRLLANGAPVPLSEQARDAAAQQIALARQTAEAREGVAAFLAKRSPFWAAPG
jgi:methylglutaconyl-CoA hydratase